MSSNPPVPDLISRTILERSSGLQVPESFGSGDDLEREGFETLLPSYAKAPISKEQPTIRIGSAACRLPYEASVLNVSALSFGPLSKNFILAVNRAARAGSFYQNTGEAGISPYHFNVDIDVEDPAFSADAFFEDLTGKYPESAQAGDVVWQLGNGYFGCRQTDGSLYRWRLRKKSRSPT